MAFSFSAERFLRKTIHTLFGLPSIPAVGVQPTGGTLGFDGAATGPIRTWVPAGATEPLVQRKSKPASAQYNTTIFAG